MGTVSSGVPQGSVLGPVLFLIYINDLPKEVKNCIRLFADDTKLYRTVTTDLDCLSLQQDIDNIEEWASKWQLKFHPKKCKTMRIGDKYPKYNYTIDRRGRNDSTTGRNCRGERSRSSCGQQINFQPSHKQNCGES